MCKIIQTNLVGSGLLSILTTGDFLLFLAGGLGWHVMVVLILVSGCAGVWMTVGVSAGAASMWRLHVCWTSVEALRITVAFLVAALIIKLGFGNPSAPTITVPPAATVKPGTVFTWFATCCNCCCCSCCCSCC
jgi:hypothetical protein